MNKYKEYAIKVIQGEIIACNYIKLACERYLSWFERDDMYFDKDAVERVINFISKLKHITGRHANKPFSLELWQKWAIYSIFAWKWKSTNTRVIKNVYIEIARKNGKSAFAVAIALYCILCDGEQNAEVEFVANSRKQAGICFTMAQNFVSTLINGKKKNKYFKIYRDKIDFLPTKSFLQVLSSDANNNDGWNSFTFICDEYHSHNTSAIYDVMKSSQGMREQPLSIVITTAGFNLFSPCYTMRKTNIEILENLKQDDTTFSAIYTLDDGDEWDDENVWEKANPNLNITVKKQYLMEQVQQAKNNNTMKVPILTKNFNVWQQASNVWLSNDELIQVSKQLKFEDFADCICNVGVDLSAVSDLTAVSFHYIKNDINYFITKYYLPNDVIQHHPNSILYKQWVKQGYLTPTNGNVVDYDVITNDLINTNKITPINLIAYDAYNSTQWAVQTSAQNLNLVPFSQAIYNFNRPTKEFERLLKGGKVVIDDNPITRWCFSNAVLKYDTNENCKPIKENYNNKIDGVIAILQALGISLTSPQFSNEIFAL